MTLREILFGRDEPNEHWMSEHYLSVGNRTGYFERCDSEAKRYDTGSRSLRARKQKDDGQRRRLDA